MSELLPLLRIAGPVILAEVGWMAMGIVDTIMMLSVGSGQLQVPASRRQQSARWLASTEDRWLFVGIGLT